MAPAVHQSADHLRNGDYPKGVVSNLAMQVAGTATLLSTAEQQAPATWTAGSWRSHR
ncbi:hypothetical protein [Micromonospora arida]|uniref:hypothetical protein n=1 Tax=Micromonospora arida TaxID=2203715 RepID=UPI001ABFCB3D|nr:hypothetical protein [Micromonospora arida]